ncbi:uncharacterized protein CC84DRAFT_1096648 [Paraphaeosphaeria sporulosa]|uniref:Altered inheritance of mitochondria protein 6 n=1 Tax=Paraphaeosphaeria sporulosa TaxID=1460663 RepID=A0A177C885_9PLEO|nr:uncharacterized protein CC84DRAFT_1096648 [Paraphaeosphaeria sporulosa]OAG02967.1 hypothetical protein CC84DRAFT_1096648 [Paraphaeosphaeria sporulosa]
MAVRRRNVGFGKEEPFDRVRFPPAGKEKSVRREWRVRRCGIKTVLGLPLLVIVFFGIVHISNVLMSLVNLVRDDAVTYSRDFLPLEQYQAGDFTGLTRNVKPIHCHSHNDYWRRVPLYEALRWGCTGVEADVWLFPERSDKLFVGHSTRDLTIDNTFGSMYVDPLMRIVDQQNTPNTPFETVSKSGLKNGVFEMDPTQTVVLLVDFKNDGHALYPVVSSQLEPLRQKGYLSYYDGHTIVPGPITIVATGNAPFDLVTRNSTHRDIFFDAPLAGLSPLSSQTTDHASKRAGGQGTVGTTPLSTFDLTNSYYASVDFKKAVGWCWFGRVSATQRELIRAQIRAAKERGLKSRYWGAPKWPVGVRNMVWRVLVEESVDYLNGDDLREMTRGDWGAKVHGSWVG